MNEKEEVSAEVLTAMQGNIGWIPTTFLKGWIEGRDIGTDFRYLKENQPAVSPADTTGLQVLEEARAAVIDALCTHEPPALSPAMVCHFKAVPLLTYRLDRSCL